MVLGLVVQGRSFAGMGGRGLRVGGAESSAMHAVGARMLAEDGRGKQTAERAEM